LILLYAYDKFFWAQQKILLNSSPLLRACVKEVIIFRSDILGVFASLADFAHMSGKFIFAFVGSEEVLPKEHNEPIT